MKEKEIVTLDSDKETFDIPLSELEAVDISNGGLETMARDYFSGKSAVAIGRKKDVRKLLETKVVDRIGKKGKHLVDKLFELIEGVYVVDKLKEVKGKEEIRYYKTPPNLNAIIYALDRVLGKPKQVSLTGSFSLSQLLIKDGRPKSNRIGPGDNGALPEKSDLFY